MKRVCQLLLVALFFVAAAGGAAQTPPLPALAANDWSKASPVELRAAAARGDAGARYFLGRALFRGEGVAQDVPAAVEWLERAATQGVLPAQLMAGAARERGLGGRIDFKQALEWYRRAAAQGNPGAQLKLALLHANNRVGGSVNIPAARDFVQPAAQQGSTIALVAANWLETQHPRRAGPPDLAAIARWQLAAALDGGADAQWQLGIRYESGQGVQRDPVAAARWYQLGARHGSVGARFALENLSRSLTGAQRAQAERLAGDFVPAPPVPLPAETHTALYYLNPAGRNSSRFAALEQTAAQGDAGAQFQLGLSLLLREDLPHVIGTLKQGHSQYDGIVTGGPMDPAPHERDAVKWLQASARQGSAGAQLQLALRVLDPLSRTTNNAAEALHWLQTLAKAGVPTAQFHLARCQFEGVGGTKDQVAALGWLRRAAESGHVPAQTNLAALLVDPSVLGADYGEGVRWLRTAATNGHPQALQDVRRIFGSTFNPTPAAPAVSAVPVALANPALPGPASAATAAAAVKLALVATGDATRPVTDLLTVSLSQAAGVTLLERAEIERVWREQSLATPGRGGSVKLGELLGADGVLLVETQFLANPTNSAAGRTNLSARLVAVKTGVTLGHLAVPFPVSNVAEWSSRAAAQFVQWLPKLAVARRDAVPVSILNLRSPLNTARAVALERELTLLLTERLLRQPEVFVLERRRMDRLTAERELGGAEEHAFWSGSYLLEGVINKDGEQADRVTVHGRLIPPGGGAASAVQVTGGRGELPQLVNELAGKIFSALNRSPVATAWGTAEEAGKYFEEARWAARWGMTAEARAAADAAWALGLRGVELATLRLECWVAELAATAPLREQWRHNARGALVAVRPPDPRQLEAALQALSFFASYGDPPPGTEAAADAAWLAAGLRAVDGASSVLRHFYHAIEARGDTGESLAELRALARKSFARVVASPRVKDGVLAVGRTVMLGGTGYWNDQSIELFSFHARCGSYWPDDANQGRAFLAALVTTPSFFGKDDYNQQPQTLRGFLLRPVPLPAWSVTERLAAPGQWTGLVSEWCRSTNAALRLEGHLQRFQAQPAGTLAEARAQGEVLLEAAWELRSLVVRGAISTNLWQLVRQTVLEKLRQRPDSREEVQEIQPNGRVAVSLRNRDEASLLGSFDTRWKQIAETFPFERLKEHLRTAEAYHKERFFRDYLGRPFSPKEAGELLPLLQSYGERLKWPGMTAGALDRLTRVLNAPTKPVVSGPAVQSSALPQPPFQTANATGPAGTTNVLHTTPFWRPPAALFPGQQISRLGLSHLQFAAGRIWAGVRYGSNAVQVTDLAVLSLEPDTLRVQSYPLPRGETGTQLGNPYFYPSFAVADSHLYVQLGDKLKRVKLGTTQWEDLPLSLPAQATLSVVHVRLYVSSADSILELNEDATGTRLLASTRRVPAETPLDTLGSLTSPPVFPGPQGMVRVLVGARLFEYDPRTRAWSEPAPPAQRQGIKREANVVLTSTMNPSADQTWHALADQKWFGLFDDESAWRRLYELSAPVLPNGPGRTRARDDDSFKHYLPPAVSRNKDVWSADGWLELAKADNAAPRWGTEGGRHFTLLLYPFGHRPPQFIPLWVEPAADGAGLPPNDPGNNGRKHRTKLIATDGGLIITESRVPEGFWLVTKAQLEPFLREPAAPPRPVTTGGTEAKKP